MRTLPSKELRQWIDKTQSLAQKKHSIFMRIRPPKVEAKLIALVDEGAKHYARQIKNGKWSELFAKPTRSAVVSAYVKEFKSLNAKGEPSKMATKKKATKKKATKKKATKKKAKKSASVDLIIEKFTCEMTDYVLYKGKNKKLYRAYLVRGRDKIFLSLIAADNLTEARKQADKYLKTQI